MPAVALLAAVIGPLVPATLAEAALGTGQRNRGSQVALVLAGAVWSAICAGAVIRWIGPELVDTTTSPSSLLAGLATGLAGLVATHRQAGRLPASQTPGVGVIVGLAASIALLIAAVFVHRATDITAEQARELPRGLDDPAPFTRIERRARIDPWDPDIHLARGWTATREEHFAQALSDLEMAERLGANHIAVAHLRADVLAGLDHCDEARVVYDRWLQLRAIDAAARAVDDPSAIVAPVDPELLGHADLEEFDADSFDQDLGPTMYRQRCGSGGIWYGE